MPDGGGRLLRIKEGHALPPSRIRYKKFMQSSRNEVNNYVPLSRFYGGLGQTVLSAGDDSTLRSFSTVTDVLDKSFGVASYSRKKAKKMARNQENTVKMEPIMGKGRFYHHNRLSRQ